MSESLTALLKTSSLDNSKLIAKELESASNRDSLDGSTRKQARNFANQFEELAHKRYSLLSLEHDIFSDYCAHGNPTNDELRLLPVMKANTENQKNYYTSFEGYEERHSHEGEFWTRVD